MKKTVLNSLSILSGPEKTKYFSLVGLRMGAQFLDMAGIFGVGLLAALLSGSALDGPLAPTLQSFGVGNLEQLPLLAAGVTSLFLMKSLLSAVLLRQTTQFLARTESTVAQRLAGYSFSGGLSTLRRQTKGDLQWAIGPSSHFATAAMLSGFGTLLVEAFLVILVLISFSFVNPATTSLVVLYFVLVFALYQIVVNSKLRMTGIRLADQSVRINDLVVDMSSSFREIHTLQKIDTFLEILGELRLQNAVDRGRQKFLMGLPRYLVESALLVGVVAMVVWRSSTGSLESYIAEIAIFLTGGVRMIASLLPLQNALSDLRAIGPQALKAQEIIQLSDQFSLHHKAGNSQDSNPHPKQLSKGSELRISNLKFAYPESERGSLHIAELTVPGGTSLAVIGDSGAGKSTLADLVLGLLEPDSGRILIDGLTPHEFGDVYGGKISYVPQRPGFFAGSIRDNIALGVPDDNVDDERIWNLMEDLRLVSVLESLPDGIRTSIGKHHDAFSGGQLQRMGIARALYPRPSLVVMDEATSALDSETEQVVTEYLQSLQGNVTTILVAHRLSTVEHADHVLLLKSGRVAKYGTWDEIRKDPRIGTKSMPKE